MDDNNIRKIVNDELLKYASRNQYGVSKIPIHTHNGTDSVQLNPKDFLGFPIVSVIPVDTPIDGTIRIYFSGVTYKLYVRVNNLWKSTALT